MRESENAPLLKETVIFSADEAIRLSALSEMIENDGLRYERLLDAEEESDEL